MIDIFITVWLVCNAVGVWNFDPAPFALLLFIINVPQLPLLPLLAISGKVIERKQALLAEEHYATTKKIYHDLDQITKHLEHLENILTAKNPPI